MVTTSSDSKLNAKVGDWVRFYQNNHLVIGVVQYTVKDSLGYMQLKTDLGSVDERYVLEVRRTIV